MDDLGSSPARGAPANRGRSQGARKVFLRAFLLASILTGCADVADNGAPINNAINLGVDLASPGARAAARAAADDTKCRSFGFVPQTEGYANCRLELERLRAGGARIQVRVR